MAERRPVAIRLTDAERARLKAAADARGTTRTAVIRELIAGLGEPMAQPDLDEREVRHLLAARAREGHFGALAWWARRLGVDRPATTPTEDGAAEHRAQVLRLVRAEMRREMEGGA